MSELDEAAQKVFDEDKKLFDAMAVKYGPEAAAVMSEMANVVLFSRMPSFVPRSQWENVLANLVGQMGLLLKRDPLEIAGDIATMADGRIFKAPVPPSMQSAAAGKLN